MSCWQLATGIELSGQVLAMLFLQEIQLDGPFNFGHPFFWYFLQLDCHCESVICFFFFLNFPFSRIVHISCPLFRKEKERNSKLFVKTIFNVRYIPKLVVFDLYL